MPTETCIIIATVTGALSVMAFYLSSHNQRLLHKPINKNIGQNIFLIFLLISGFLLYSNMGAAAASFTLFVIYMTWLTFIPSVITYLKRRKTS